MADGFTLIVPKEMIDRLDVADQKIAKLADTAEKSTKRINEAFNNIAVNGGLDAFIKKLNEANTTLSKMSVNTNGLKDITNAFKEINKVSNKSGDTSPVNDAAVQTSVDKINELVNSLVRLKELNQISLQTQQAGVDYAQQANDIKELANAEAERERALNREDVAREKNNKNEQSLATQRLANDTKELLNAELERNKQLSVESANIKNNYAQQSLEAKRVANDVKEAMYAEQERARQMQLQNQKNIAAYKEQSAELKRQIAEIERLAKAYKEMPTTFSWDDLSQHIDASKGATSINQRIVAIHNLKSALKDLDTTDVNYKQHAKELNDEIARQEKELNKVGVRVKDATQKKKGLLNISDQLQRKLALLFSVSAIQGYIGKLVKVRSEFELQRRSLEILLQSKENADKIYGQTVQLALKSPFRVQELVKYTKQLAAYRIESDKLHDTTKRLADVSAGLGVDMQRLILAFGQVRAAEFLRGTELRQFTEAGIPMLEELAKYFSEIEGKTVKAGEVFERIGKRGVLFKDVEEVFKRLTSEGGIFYRMQEQQADTLAGRISNMHDRIDLMLNDIGRSKDGLFTEFISIVNSLFESWRMLADQIYIASGAMLFMKIRMSGLGLAAKQAGNQIAWVGKSLTGMRSLKDVAKAFQEGTVSAKGFFGFLKVAGLGAILSVQGALVALKAALSTFLPVIALTALTELIYFFTKSSEAAREFEEAVERINREMSDELSNSISLYERLATRIRDVTNTEKDRNDALNEMSRHFKDILPDQYLELQYVQNLKDGYKGVRDAMTQYYNDKSIALKKSQAEEVYGKEIMAESASLKHDFKDVLNTIQSEKGTMDSLEKRFGEGVVDAIIGGYSYAFENAIDRMKKGEIAATTDSFKSEVEKQLTEMYKGQYDFSGLFNEIGFKGFGLNTIFKGLEFEGVAKNIHEVVKGVEDYKSAMAGIEGFKFQTPEMKAETKAYELMSKGLENVKKKIEDLKLAYSDYYNFKKKEKPSSDNEGELKRYEKEEKEIQERIQKGYEDLSIKVPVVADVSKLSESTYMIGEEMRNVEQIALTSFAYTVNPALKDTATTLNNASDSVANISNRFQTVTPEIQNMNLSLEGFTTIAAAGTDTILGFNHGLFNATDTAFMGFTKAERAGNDFVDMITTKGYSSIEQLGETALQTAENLDPTPLQTYTNEVIDEVLKAHGLGAEVMDKFRANNEANLDSFTTKFHEDADNWILTWWWVRDQIAQNPAHAQIILQTVKWTTEDLKDAPEIEKVLTTLKNRFPKKQTKIPKPKTKKDKKPKPKANKTDDPSDDYIEFLEDMYKKFQELSEDMSADAAKEEVIKAYTETFKKLTKLKGIFKEGISEIDFTTTEGLVDALKKIEPLITKSKDVWRDYNLTISDYISDIKIEKLQELNDEADRQVDLLFEGYEIAKDLDKLGISPEWAKNLFAIKATDIKSLRAGVAAAYGDPEESKKTIKETSKNISEIAKGNVDVFNHQLMPAISLYTAGWEEAGQAAENTFFAVEKVIKDNKGVEQNILITPILPDGTILSPDELDAYINKNLSGKDILTADKKGKKKAGKGIVISVGAEENADYLNQQARMYYNAKMMEMAFGKERLETIQETNDKIDKEENERQLERLKKYVEYAKKSVSERAKLKLEELTRIAEIEETFAVKDGDSKDVVAAKESLRAAAIEKSQKEYAEALKKLEWEEFQKSDMFLMLFEDLDSASEQLMQHTLDQLKNFKEQWADMPLEDVKAITDKINDLESALINLKNPWKAIKTINQNIDSITNGKSRKQLYDEAMFAQTEMNRNNEEIAQLQVIRDLMWNGKEIAKEQIDLILAFSPAWDGTIEALDAIIFRKNNMNKGYMRTIGLARELTQQEKDAIKTYNRQEDAYNEINSLAKKLYDASKELVELFVDEDSLVTVFADMGMNMASTVLDTLALQANIAATRVSLQAAQVEAQAFGLAMNSAAGIVGWIVMGIQLLSQVLSAIFNAHDKAKQKEIDKEIENVEKLEKALEDLEERLESVYSMGQLNSAMRQTQTNIDKQIRSYEKMMRLEEEKKKTDKDQIKEWQESIDELREKRLELHKEMVESLGGDYDIRSVARDFVDAWIDAFKETGDGLKGLRENFKEFFLNILLEQAVMKKVGGLFGDAMNYLNDVVLSDYIVTDAERKKTEGMFDAAMIKTNDYLNMLFGENGVLNKYIDDTDSSLSGLQQGVQGVTEETAQIIEAYLNSIRFYIAQDNQNLADLRNFFIGSEADTNPILSQLKMQTELIRAIKDMFSSVIYSGGHSTYGGAFLKVSL